MFPKDSRAGKAWERAPKSPPVRRRDARATSSTGFSKAKRVRILTGEEGSRASEQCERVNN